ALYTKFIKAYKKEFELPKYADRLTKTDMCSQFSDMNDFFYSLPSQLTATQKNSSRYKVFNFCKSFHGTLEIRIFPYVTTIDGLSKIVDFVYKFFSEYKTPEYKPLKKILEHDKISLSVNSMTGSILKSFSHDRYTISR